MPSRGGGPRAQLLPDTGAERARTAMDDPRTLEVLIDSITQGIERDFRAPFFDLVLGAPIRPCARGAFALPV